MNTETLIAHTLKAQLQAKGKRLKAGTTELVLKIKRTHTLDPEDRKKIDKQIAAQKKAWLKWDAEIELLDTALVNLLRDRKAAQHRD